MLLTRIIRNQCWRFNENLKFYFLIFSGLSYNMHKDNNGCLAEENVNLSEGPWNKKKNKKTLLLFESVDLD